jgi:ComF family protein
MLKLAFNFVKNFIFPNSCFLCATPDVEYDGFCNDCYKQLNFVSEPVCNVCGRLVPIVFQNNIEKCSECQKGNKFYDNARALLQFNEGSKSLVHKFKYYDQTRLASVVSKLIYFRYKKKLQDYDCIIPVPMYKIKRIFRLYNQSQILATKIGKLMQKPVDNQVLFKTKWTKPQSTLTLKKRKENLLDSFLSKNIQKIKSKKIILVDDVITTGNTINTCSKILKKSGASSVFVLAIAMT